MEPPSSGRRRAGNIPTYNLEHWRFMGRDQSGFRFRPGGRVLGTRLAGSFVAALLIGVFYHMHTSLGPADLAGGAVPPVATGPEAAEIEAATERLTQDTRNRMSPEEWQAVEQRIAEERAEREAAQAESTRRMATLSGGMQMALGGLMGVLAAVGVLVPLSCLWNRVSIERDMRGDLVVRKWGVLFPSTKRWRVDSLKRMSILAHEVMAGGRQWRTVVGWRWRVRLAIDPRTGDNGVEFWPHRQKERPSTSRLPQPVSTLVGALHELTGLPQEEPSIMDSVPGGRFGGSRQIIYRGEPVVTHQTFETLDDVPEHLRPQFEELMAKANPGGIPPGEIHHTKKRVFHSLDELPEHMRAQVQQMMAEADKKGGSSFRKMEHVTEAITVTDSGGNVRTYHSVDEMPPDIRAVYERARGDMG